MICSDVPREIPSGESTRFDDGHVLATIGDRPRFEAAVLDLGLDELDGEPAAFEGFVV